MRNKWMITVGTLLALGVAQAETAVENAALAAENNAELSAESEDVVLEQVMVTAMLVEQELKDVPLSVSVITEEEIERSTASTVGELLQDIQGCRHIKVHRLLGWLMSVSVARMSVHWFWLMGFRFLNRSQSRVCADFNIARTD